MPAQNKFFDRELSWLSFNNRVLQEAADHSNPLSERIKFLGIFSNNQDEFYRVRIATINRLLELDKTGIDPKTSELKNIIKLINKEIKRFQQQFSAIYTQIKQELKTHNIYIINESELTNEQGEIVRHFFNEKVRHHLFPIMLTNFNRTSLLTDQSIYLAVKLGRTNRPDRDEMAIIEIPAQQVGRFFTLPQSNDKKFIIHLDDVIRFCLDDVFKRFKYDSYTAYTFKFTRDAELDIDNDVSKSFLERVSEGIAQRSKGTALRFVHDREMPADVLKAITGKLKITRADTISEGGRYHNFKDYMSFPNLGGPGLENIKIEPVIHKLIPDGASIIRAIRANDIMLHYPYQSFQYIVDLLREASIDPKVVSIKMTLYRLSNPSNVINALINAVRNGKQVTVFLELQARFDEEANIYWSGVLQQAGATVLSGIPGLKVHSKLILIKRKEYDGYRLYANVGTGNFHEKTGNIYCDNALLTADPLITADVEKVFDFIQMPYRIPHFNTLIVSPFSTRAHFIRLIDTEIRNARLGRPAWIILKMNSLSDIKLINKLYRASQAGVKISLIIRGICKLVPGIAGLSENITAISIVDKFLEHSRIMIFCGGGDEKYFISSADWMIRNLDNRIEVTVPIFNGMIRSELKDILGIQLNDNVKARVIDNEMSNKYVTGDNTNKVRAQEAIFEYLKQVHKK